MHLAQPMKPIIGSEPADLIHPAVLSKPFGKPEPAILSLLLQPVWRREHLKVLKVNEKVEVPTTSIVNKFHLPKDGRDDFEDLATDIEKPSAQDLAAFPATEDAYRRNAFHPFFSDLYEMAGFETGRTSQNRYVRYSKSAIRHLIDAILPYIDDGGSLRIESNSIPFFLRRIAVKGVLTCDGCIIKTDMTGAGDAALPVATFSVVRPRDSGIGLGSSEDLEAQEASQLVLQAALAYEENPTLNVYRAYAFRIDHTKMQIVSAEIRRAYLERLYQGQSCPQGFDVLHSPECDLMDEQGRREALRVAMGLLKCLRTKPMQRPF